MTRSIRGKKTTMTTSSVTRMNLCRTLSLSLSPSLSLYQTSFGRQRNQRTELAEGQERDGARLERKRERRDSRMMWSPRDWTMMEECHARDCFLFYAIYYFIKIILSYANFNTIYTVTIELHLKDFVLYFLYLYLILFYIWWSYSLGFIKWFKEVDL